MKRVLLATAALVAAVAVLRRLSLPPAACSLLAGAPTDGTVPGVFHVHTNRSDGRSTPDEIAAAAARAGLKFVVFTDHGDGTGTPDAPAYRSGVLCLDGVEISTTAATTSRSTCRRRRIRSAASRATSSRTCGGSAGSASPRIRIRRRTSCAGASGTRRSTASSWSTPIRAGARASRRTAGGRWSTAFGTYPFRPSETIGQLFGESTAAPARWESLTRRRRVVALGGTDAHAKLAFGDVDPGDNRFSLPIPSYEAAFGSLTLHARLDGALSGDPRPTRSSS